MIILINPANFVPSGRLISQYHGSNLHINILLFFSLLSPLIAQKPAEPIASVVRGFVKSPDGKPLAGVRVRAVRINPDLWSSLPVDSVRGGSFTLNGLPDGAYLLCASAKQRFLLADPCTVRGASPKGQIQVKGGSPIPSQTVEMEDGALLRVRVKDRDRLLQEKLNSEATPPQNRQIRSLNVFGWLPGSPTPQRLLATQGGADEVLYEMVVPRRLASVRLLVEPIGLAVTEDGSSAPSPGGRIDRSVSIPMSKGSVAELVLSTARPQK